MTEVKYSLPMSWMATERFEARSGPGGLGLVQDLVNTHAVERDGFDLLSDHATAQHWLQEASRQWASDRALPPPDPTLPKTDLQPLRDLRTAVLAILETPPGQRSADSAGAITERAQVQLATDDHDRVAMIPLGSGAAWLTSAIWSEILLSQQTGTWAKVKLCREPGCRTAFYDASRNGSGTWHNVRTCGNIANLRASRTRRKSAPHQLIEAGQEEF